MFSLCLSLFIKIKL